MKLVKDASIIACSYAQKKMLARLGIKWAEAENLSKADASVLIDRLLKKEQATATPKAETFKNELATLLAKYKV